MMSADWLSHLGLIVRRHRVSDTLPSPPPSVTGPTWRTRAAPDTETCPEAAGGGGLPGNWFRLVPESEHFFFCRWNFPGAPRCFTSEDRKRFSRVLLSPQPVLLWGLRRTPSAGNLCLRTQCVSAAGQSRPSLRGLKSRSPTDVEFGGGVAPTIPSRCFQPPLEEGGSTLKKSQTNAATHLSVRAACVSLPAPP